MTSVGSPSVKKLKLMESLPASATQQFSSLTQRYQKINADYQQTLKTLRKLEQQRLNIKRALQQLLTKHQIKSCELPNQHAKIEVILGKSCAVIQDKDKVPSDYCSLQHQVIFDLHKIETDLKKGKLVPGAQLEQLAGIEITMTSITKREEEEKEERKKPSIHNNSFITHPLGNDP